MSRIRGVDTKPEFFVRRTLHALGYRFRKHVGSLPGRPDVVFSRRRVAVFVHGCFWHRQGCGKTYTPRSRKRFWEAKFAGNVERDKRDPTAPRQRRVAGRHRLGVRRSNRQGTIMNNHGTDLRDVLWAGRQQPR